MDERSVGGGEGTRRIGSAGPPIPLDPSTGLPPRRICDRASGPAQGGGFTIGVGNGGGEWVGLLLGDGTKTSWDFRLTSAAFDRKTAASNLPAVSCWNDVPFQPQKK